MRPGLQRLAQVPLNTAQGEDLPERAGISRREEKVREKRSGSRSGGGVI